MGEHSTSRTDQPVSEPGSVTPVQGQSRPLNGWLSAGVQEHAAGIGIGAVGLLVGALVANPLIAFAGLVGGIAAGTVLFDKQRRNVNHIGHDPELNPGAEFPSASGPALAVSPTVIAADPEFTGDVSIVAPYVGAPMPAKRRIR